MPKEMTAADVLEIVRLFAENEIGLVVDGGWAVDALLGKQTRPHDDLDIAVEHAAVPRLRALLAEHGYQEVPRDDSWECNFVLEDSAGRQIDVHSYTFDENGQHVYGVAYPFESLNGRGSILGQPVRCIPPTWLVAFHTGYPLDANDYHDVKALCQHFNLPLPAEYAPFVQAESGGEA